MMESVDDINGLVALVTLDSFGTWVWDVEDPLHWVTTVAESWSMRSSSWSVNWWWEHDWWGHSVLNNSDSLGYLSFFVVESIISMALVSSAADDSADNADDEWKAANESESGSSSIDANGSSAVISVAISAIAVIAVA